MTGPDLSSTWATEADMLRRCWPSRRSGREALNLSAQERIELVVELWDSLAPGEIPAPNVVGAVDYQVVGAISRAGGG